MPLDELNRARTRANPFETIRSAFFMNRAALKMANIDAATNYMFSKVDENVSDVSACANRNTNFFFSSRFSTNPKVRIILPTFAAVREDFQSTFCGVNSGRSKELGLL